MKFRLKIKIQPFHIKSRFLIPGEGIRGDDPGGHLLDGFEHQVLDVMAFQDVTADRIDRFALAVHDIVEFQQVFADLKIMRLHPFLRVLDGHGQPRVFEHLAFLHPQLVHDPHDPVGGEQAHQIVLERNVKPR